MTARRISSEEVHNLTASWANDGKLDSDSESTEDSDFEIDEEQDNFSDNDSVGQQSDLGQSTSTFGLQKRKSGFNSYNESDSSGQHNQVFVRLPKMLFWTTEKLFLKLIVIANFVVLVLLKLLEFK